MQYRRLGRSGLRVSEVGLGSWLTFGSSVEARETERIVRHAFALGIRFFDTADVYARGRSEEVLGSALRGIPRHQLVIASKAFFPMSEDPNDRGLSRKHLFESVHASLRRLGTDYLDLHQCHRPDPETPLDETVRAYEDLIRQGKVLYWGVSEWSGAQIESACRLAGEHGAYAPVSNQPRYSILRRDLEREVLPACERLGVGQVVFSPLGQGALTGKYAGGQRPSGSRATDPQRNTFMDDYLRPDVLARVEELRPLAAEAGCTPGQLALAWCLSHANVASTIVGVTRESQLRENAGASGIRLPPDLVARIDSLFPIELR